MPSILSFVQNLPGFYIAALAAIATFGRHDIDEAMPGSPPPRIKTITTSGHGNVIVLMRRRFLCLLFAYLTVECIALTLFSIFAISLAPAMRGLVSPIMLLIGHAISSVVVLFLLTQLMVATLWGLYYLDERIHQPDT